MDKELRSFQTEIRAGQGDEDQLTLIGRAVSYNTLSAPIPAGNGKVFRERCAPGCFKRSLADQSNVVLANYNHQSDTALPLGSTESGTLKLQDKPDGLYFRIQLDKNQQAHRELHASCKRGDVSKCSWEFTPEEDGEDWDIAQDEEGRSFNRRTLKAVKLYAVTVTPRPAYPGDATTVQARAELSEDAELRRRVKELGDKIEAEKRYGASGAGPGDAGFGRMEGDGQTQDPTQSLRCPGRSLTSNRADHVDASEKHRCLAQRCSVASRADLHYRASEAHKAAAGVSPDDENLYAETCGKAVVACQRAHDYQNMGAE